jgi:midasin (ATPase involved in ribosome maturation)
MPQLPSHQGTELHCNGRETRRLQPAATGSIRQSDTLLPPPNLALLEFAQENHLHCLLTGPRGSGKNFAVEYIAQQVGKKLYRIQTHSDLVVEEMRGSAAILDGSSIFVYGTLVAAAREGAMLLIDEANFARQGILALINNATDDSRLIAIPERQEVIEVHPEFQCFLCINPGYYGTKPLNEALIDRFLVIEFDYWDRDSESRLLHFKLPQLGPGAINDMLDIAAAIREARKQHTHDFDLSIRTLVQWGQHADQVSQDLYESFQVVVLPKMGDRHEYQLQREALLEIARLKLT